MNERDYGMVIQEAKMKMANDLGELLRGHVAEDELIRAHYDFEAPQDQWKKVRLLDIAREVMPKAKDTGKAIRSVSKALSKMGMEFVKSNVSFVMMPPKKKAGMLDNLLSDTIL